MIKTYSNKLTHSSSLDLCCWWDHPNWLHVFLSKRAYSSLPTEIHISEYLIPEYAHVNCLIMRPLSRYSPNSFFASWRAINTSDPSIVNHLELIIEFIVVPLGSVDAGGCPSSLNANIVSLKFLTHLSLVLLSHQKLMTRRVVVEIRNYVAWSSQDERAWTKEAQTVVFSASLAFVAAAHGCETARIGNNGVAGQQILHHRLSYQFPLMISVAFWRPAW